MHEHDLTEVSFHATNPTVVAFNDQVHDALARLNDDE
jgi:hypothetical protein